MNPPPIDPVATNASRPLWSVMIPTYNCAALLRQTLQSVLTQAPGPEEMQIEVNDDCSSDDPEAVVHEVGGGRVAFHRNAKNVGGMANFNNCLNRSRGQLVHILHGDDFVLPGFYGALAAAAAKNPDVAFLAARVFYVDEDGYFSGVSPRVRSLERAGRSAREFYYETAAQFAGIVVRRTFYETHGGFIPELTHLTDREMWIRAITRGGGVVLPDALAGYRRFDSNMTARNRRTAEDMRALERLHLFLARTLPDFDAPGARRRLLEEALDQYWRFVTLGDAEAAAANLKFWRERAVFRDRVRLAISRVRRRLDRAA
jgi:glycosyltransferase involved in cell wall biosynthesis